MSTPATYVADVSLGPHPTAPGVIRVLTVKLLTQDKNEIQTVCDLYGHESAKDFKWSPELQLPESRLHLAEIAADFVAKVGTNGVVDFQLPDFDKRVEEFEVSWKKTAFTNALRNYGVTNRLTFEQALRVLEEHYIVEPIMES